MKGCLIVASVIQAVPAAFVIFFVFLLPESPRYMYMKGKKEEAFAFLTKVSFQECLISLCLKLMHCA